MFELCRIFEGSISYHGDVILSYTPVKRHTKFSQYLSVYHPTVSSVGIAIDYRLNGPGSNPGGDEIFRLSRPALGPTQPPVKWAPGLSRG